jgi:hypothetical protein
MFISKYGINVSTSPAGTLKSPDHFLIHDLVEIVKDFMCDQPVDKRHAFRILAEADEVLRGK